jgi:RNA polymerase sigma factor (sigma-70 family)
MEDRELLRQFVIDRSEAAFAKLVRRYVDLVYSSALRQMKDPAGAEDVTQSVFVLLAAKARSIQSTNAMGGWLLAATREIALNFLRADFRRRRHESEAAVMNHEIRNEPDSNWSDVKEFLDDAVARLKPVDRDALTLRYFQNREVPEVAAALGISPLAAQKRVSRAVARLRDLLARKGIITSSDALSTLLLTHAVSPAPAALSGSIASSALSTAKTIASIKERQRSWP